MHQCDIIKNNFEKMQKGAGFFKFNQNHSK